MLNIYELVHHTRLLLLLLFFTVLAFLTFSLSPFIIITLPLLSYF